MAEEGEVTEEDLPEEVMDEVEGNLSDERKHYVVCGGMAKDGGCLITLCTVSCTASCSASGYLALQHKAQTVNCPPVGVPNPRRCCPGPMPQVLLPRGGGAALPEPRRDSRRGINTTLPAMCGATDI